MDNKVRAKWEKFLAQLPVVTYKKGEIILFQGETPRHGFVIKKGIIKTYNLNSGGDEQLVYFNSTLDLFPQAWIMHKAATSLYYYQALTVCELYQLPHEAYLDFIRNDKELLLYELERSAGKDVGKTMRLNALLYSKASDKVLNTLHYLAQSHGIRMQNNLIRINLVLTHQDLANLTGLRRETVAVEMNRLKKRGVVYYRRRALYHVNMAMLNKMLSDQFIVESQLRL
jgi:CRP/FNR family cyclic AMP-dependent transcriptional regulator